MANVSFLLATTPDDWDRYIKWFRAQLKKLNKNATVTLYPADGAGGDAAAVLQAATDLANDASVEVIVTAGTMGALACRQATQANQKPFVFAAVGDATKSGLL